MKKENKKGFSLLEVIVSITILGILLAVLIPNVVSYIAKSQRVAAIQDASNVYTEWANAYTYCDQEDVNTYLQDKYNLNSNPTNNVVGFYHNYGKYTVLIRGGEVIEVLNKRKPKYFFLDDDRKIEMTDTDGLDNGYNTGMNFESSTEIKDGHKGKYVYIPRLDPDSCTKELYDYNKVTFIEATNGAYIDLGFKPNQDTRVDIEFSVRKDSTDVNWLYGAREAYNSNTVYGLFLDAKVASNHLKYKYGHYEQLIEYTNFEYDRENEPTVKVTTDKNLFYVNDDIANALVAPPRTFQTTNNLYLFTMNNGNTGPIQGHDARTATGQIHYCRVYDNGVLIRDLYPCSTSVGGKFGFYDMLNNKFYGNAAESGSFEFGAEDSFK
ncbi:MAG: type II secretion system protein [Bacillales bacterium]|nr:type II secretion system protein [Bacillales bacterium]